MSDCCRGISPPLQNLNERSRVDNINGYAGSTNHCQTINNGHNSKQTNGHNEMNGMKISVSATTSSHHSKGHNNHSDSSSSSSSNTKSNVDRGESNHQKVCDTVNGGHKELSNGFATSNGSQGSPLRSQLGLTLKSNTPATSSKQSPLLQCPICPYSSHSANTLEEHINRSHFDPLSPSVLMVSSNNSDTLTALACPICGRAFESSPDLELHVNIEHRYTQPVHFYCFIVF